MNHHHHGGKKSAEASITTGIVFTLAFGIAWKVTGIWAFAFPMFFAGVLPAVEGIRRLICERESGEKKAVDFDTYGEKQVLQTAKEEKGIVTPALVALETSLSITQAEQILEKMAKKGYVVMHVKDDGRIEYEFPEFTPRVEE